MQRTLAIPGRPPAADAPAQARSRGAPAMWWIAAAIACVFVGGTLPTPLYVSYRNDLHFSQITLTLVYAIYVVGTLFSVTFLGRLSDQIGRRPTALAAVAIAAVSAIVFLGEAGLAMLFVGRLLSGLSIGLMAGAGTAWIAELYDGEDSGTPALVASGATLAGLGSGPLIAGLLAEYAPWPLRLPYVAFLALLVPLFLAVRRAPETVAERVGRLGETDLKPRLGVPRRVLPAFLPPAAAAFATFSLSGFYAALTPTLLSGALGIDSHAVGGAVVFLYFLTGTLALAALKEVSSRTAMLAGLALLIPSLVLLILAREAHSLASLLGASVVGGVAMALSFRGSLQAVNRIAPDDRRAEVVSSFLAIAYFGIALPVIGVAALAALTGAMLANIVFAATIAVFAVAALVAGIRHVPRG